MMEMSDKENLKSGEQSKASPVGRRKFLKVASVSAPIISTIASKPVWAGHCSISGNLSGNLSNHHDDQPCSFNTYSHGGWLNGSASNLWVYLPSSYQKGSDLANLLPVPFIAGTILDALNGNLAVPNNQKGWIQQATTAALNAVLWEQAVLTYQSNPNHPMFNDIADDFYFPVPLSEIQAIYALGKDQVQQDAWEEIQNID